MHALDFVETDLQGLAFPDFVRPISDQTARRRRWRHNIVSWMAIPCRALGQSRAAGCCGILMYHRVCPKAKGRFAPTYSVTPARFRSQLAWLLNHGYQAARLDQIVASFRNGIPIAERSFVVTFDDGYDNNFTHALLVLKELQVPATVFLATAYLDSSAPFPFDDWMIGAPADLPPQTWQPITRDHCRQMLDSGWIQLGAHTHTHADFRNRPHAFAADLEICLQVLENEFDVRDPAFAYPFGDPVHGFSANNLAEVVRQYRCLCGLEIGNRTVQEHDETYRLPRFDVASADCGPSLAAKLDGWMETLRNTARAARKLRK